LTKFRFKKRTPTETRAYLLDFARYGQGGPPERRAIRTEEELKSYYEARGGDYKKQFEEARHKDAIIGLLTVHLDTNLLSKISASVPPGGSFIAFGNPVDGFTYLKGESGHIVTVQYVDSLDYAIKNLDRCVGSEKPDYRDLLSSFASGMASIEAFLNDQVRRHLPFFITGDDQILERTSVETKIFEWLPRLYPNNPPVNKGEANWQAYKELRRIRNEYHIHPKGEIYSVTTTQFCQRLNLFKTGIARLLLDLHALTSAGATPDLLKYAYLPEIEMVDQ
jgi:hypothetical protein